MNFFNIFFDPLMQFDAFTFFLSINVSILLFFFFSFFFSLILSTTALTKNFWTIFFIYKKNFWLFLDSLITSNLTTQKLFIIGLFFIVFFSIFCLNAFGLIPFSFTVTSSFIFTILLSFTFFCLINIFAIIKLGLSQFLKLFLPNGTPLPIIILLVLIEIISYSARLVSLAIRLFANMMSGHALLKILIGFSFILFIALNFIGVGPWIIVVIIFILEVLIAFLQSYVFVILITIYLNDVNTNH